MSVQDRCGATFLGSSDLETLQRQLGTFGGFLSHGGTRENLMKMDDLGVPLF